MYFLQERRCVLEVRGIESFSVFGVDRRDQFLGPLGFTSDRPQTAQRQGSTQFQQSALLFPSAGQRILKRLLRKLSVVGRNEGEQLASEAQELGTPMVVANTVAAGQALLDLGKATFDVASAKVRLDKHRGIVGLAQANGRAFMDRKAAPKVGKSLLQLTTRLVRPPAQHRG